MEELLRSMEIKLTEDTEVIVDKLEMKQSEVIERLRKAAEQGDAAAQYNLAMCYDTGRGIPENIEKAAEWYRRAAEQGHAFAQNELGWRYENGYGVPQSYRQAIEWYRKAAEQGNEDAELYLITQGFVW